MIANRPKKVFISTSSFAQYDSLPIRLLVTEGMEVQLNPYKRKLMLDECLDLYKDIDGLVAGTEALTAEVLRSAEKLKVISRCGTGVDSIDREVAAELGIKIFTTPDAPTQAVAELTIGLMLDLLRTISEQSNQLKLGKWKQGMGYLLSGKTLGILGLGRIGKRVVELTQPFNLKYIAWDVSPDRQFASRFNIELTSLGKLLRKADIVTIHLPYTLELEGVIGDRELSLMKQEAFLLNTARGGLVDETALYKALKEGEISGAALDTFEQEPYTGPLRQVDNVILTPHIGSYAREARVEMEVQAAKNLIEGLREER